ncbi:MAG: hypothetical protein EXR75_03675 [Myxococcales bacterium]|nr:hypothetical protein [Myxococcales bacterium]
MGRHRAFVFISLATVAAIFLAWYTNQHWSGWAEIYKMISKGDNMPIAGLIPLIIFFTYLSLDEAFRHDRLIRQGRQDEVLDEMYK